MDNKIIVALSGSGRSLRNLLEHQRIHKSFEICGIISSNPTALGVSIAREHEIDVYCEKFKGSSEASIDLCHWLEEKKPNLIALAGFLKRFPTKFKSPELNQIKIINIHPSLLPKFSGKGMYGSKVHRAVLAEGEKETGASIHFVNHIYDDGPLISQRKVPVLINDTEEILAARVFEAECFLYPQTIEKILTKNSSHKKIRYQQEKSLENYDNR